MVFVYLNRKGHTTLTSKLTTVVRLVYDTYHMDFAGSEPVSEWEDLVCYMAVGFLHPVYYCECEGPGHHTAVSFLGTVYSFQWSGGVVSEKPGALHFCRLYANYRFVKGFII